MKLTCDHVPCNCENECAYLEIRELEQNIPQLPDVPTFEEEEEMYWANCEDSVDRLYYDYESIGEQ